MAEVAPLDVPDLLIPSVDDSFISTSSTSPRDASLLDISHLFNLDYLTLKHDAEIEAMRANMHPPPPPLPPTSPSANPRPRSAHNTGHRGASREDSHRLLLLSAEKGLLEDRVRMMERLLSNQNGEMEEYVTSTAALYVKLSEHQRALTDVSHARDAAEKELATCRTSHDALQRETDRVKAERERERESLERHIAALKKELSDVRTRWVEGTGELQRLSDERQQSEEQYGRRIDELERQRERWEKGERTVVNLQEKLEELKRENERLKEETIRVCQLTVEVSGLHEVVERLHAERKAYEEERAMWAQERREGERREKELKDALLTAELWGEKALREKDAIKREVEDARGRHQREVSELEQRRLQEREEAQRKSKLLKGELRSLREELQRVAHPDHEENNRLKAQLIQLMEDAAQLKDRVHRDDLVRVTAQATLDEHHRRIHRLTTTRSRLLHRLQVKAQQVVLAQSFYQWAVHIQVKRVLRRQETGKGKVEGERKEAEAEERRQEKVAMEGALRELQERMKRMDEERVREDERRKMEERRRARHEDGEEEERRKQKEREREREEKDERRRQREEERDATEVRQRKERELMEARQREMEEKEERERLRWEVEEAESQRSPSPQRHRHRHYLTPSPVLSAVPFPQPAALSALLALSPSSSSPEDAQLASRMQQLLSKLRTLQQMREDKQVDTEEQQSAEEGAERRADTAHLPVALLAPPMKVGLLHPALSALPPSAVIPGKENRPVRPRSQQVKRQPVVLSTRSSATVEGEAVRFASIVMASERRGHSHGQSTPAAPRGGRRKEVRKEPSEVTGEEALSVKSATRMRGRDVHR